MTEPERPGERVVVGLDGSESSKEALREGLRLAQALDLPLEAVMCWEDPLLFESYRVVDPEEFRVASEQLLERTLAEVLGPERPARLTSRLLRGRPAEQLIECSEGARMLVVGSRGRGGVAGMLLGSVGSALVSHARCPVLVVRH
ncbi:universal stress protein UspA [Kocuria flava]|uniref:Universal stress protein n=1 Tax=Kocuria flava TaxID=446860 RepID=A0A0U3HWS2_9MICC|nr:universal stress protein [Kocuria flava]ALU39351.1 universal stress protein UspA [Kocuria flava]GEO93316.1 universal stress protein [Kocuria flava]